MSIKNAFKVGEFVIVYQNDLYYKAQVVESQTTNERGEECYLVRYVVSLNINNIDNFISVASYCFFLSFISCFQGFE